MRLYPNQFSGAQTKHGHTFYYARKELRKYMSRKSIRAFALGSVIIIRDTHSATRACLTHEAVHVTQSHRDALFLVKYLLYNATYGYHYNPYEIEARARAALEK
jgi:hypothetical protein